MIRLKHFSTSPPVLLVPSCFVLRYIISMSPHSVDRWSLIVVGVHFSNPYILNRLYSTVFWLVSLPYPYSL